MNDHHRVIEFQFYRNKHSRWFTLQFSKVLNGSHKTEALLNIKTFHFQSNEWIVADLIMTQKWGIDLLKQQVYLLQIGYNHVWIKKY